MPAGLLSGCAGNETLQNVGQAVQDSRESVKIPRLQALKPANGGFCKVPLFSVQGSHGDVVVRLVEMREEEDIQQSQPVDGQLLLNRE